MDKIKFSENFT